MSNRPTITAKQQMFATFVAQGDNNTEAYRKAYDTSAMSDQVIRNSAFKLAKNEKVRNAIDSLKDETRQQRRARRKLTGDWIIEQLQDEALNARNPAASRIRALELLGKRMGFFDDSTQVTVKHQSPEEIEKELIEKLGELLSIEA
tara:strand:- start:840 stop:1277 length:438 start_codon:yes stop_codon:yes gene_type:complete